MIHVENFMFHAENGSIREFFDSLIETKRNRKTRPYGFIQYLRFSKGLSINTCNVLQVYGRDSRKRAKG